MLPAGHLAHDKAASVVRQLAEYGFSKITFAGGEPTLCPWLSDLISLAKEAGMVTMLVTNGSRLNMEMLKKLRPALDWVVLSIDSIISETNLKGGRYQNKRMLPDVNYYLNLINTINASGYKFKINTVVHCFNKEEVMSEFIELANPLRWKIFKVLSIENQNQSTYADFEINNTDFLHYLKNNKTRYTERVMVIEDNDAMSESYLMIDPAGRFFDNSTGSYTYSQSICDVGVFKALNQINFDYEKYRNRGGVYKW